MNRADRTELRHALTKHRHPYASDMRAMKHRLDDEYRHLKDLLWLVQEDERHAAPGEPCTTRQRTATDAQRAEVCAMIVEAARHYGRVEEMLRQPSAHALPRWQRLEEWAEMAHGRLVLRAVEGPK